MGLIAMSVHGPAKYRGCLLSVCSLCYIQRCRPSLLRNVLTGDQSLRRTGVGDEVSALISLLHLDAGSLAVHLNQELHQGSKVNSLARGVVDKQNIAIELILHSVDDHRQRVTHSIGLTDAKQRMLSLKFHREVLSLLGKSNAKKFAQLVLLRIVRRSQKLKTVVELILRHDFGNNAHILVRFVNKRLDHDKFSNLEISKRNRKLVMSQNMTKLNLMKSSTTFDEDANCHTWTTFRSFPMSIGTGRSKREPKEGLTDTVDSVE